MRLKTYDENEADELLDTHLDTCIDSEITAI